MEKISESILQTGLMREILKDLSEEEIEDLKDYIAEFIEPIDCISAMVKDMMSTSSSKEKIAEDIIRLFTPEGNEELEKCLEKS